MYIDRKDTRREEMIKLYFIRHGRQNSGLCNVDVPLDEAGRQQAQLVANRLKAYNIDKLYCSNLIRAKETAEIIGKELVLEAIVEDNLREISYGDMEGLDSQELKRLYWEFLEKRKMAKEDIPCPGGESGEDVYNRAMPVIKKIIKEAMEAGNENIAIVTHGGLIRSVVAGIMEADFAKKLCVAKDLENCSITEIDYDSSTENFILERLNDFAHIEVEPMLLRKYFKRSL